MISRAMFRIDIFVGPVRIAFFEILKLLLHGRKKFFRFEVFDEIIVILFSDGLIENVILLVLKIDAAEAVSERFAVVTIGGVDAIFTIVHEIAIVASLAVGALVTKFALRQIHAVDRVFAVFDTVIEITIFAIDTGETEITIF